MRWPSVKSAPAAQSVAQTPATAAESNPSADAAQASPSSPPPGADGAADVAGDGANVAPEGGGLLLGSADGAGDALASLAVAQKRVFRKKLEPFVYLSRRKRRAGEET